MQFFGETADRSDYRVAAGAGLMTALLLVLGLVAVLSLRGPAWLVYLTGAGIATQLALGITAWWSSREVDDSVVLTKSAWDGVKDVFVLPRVVAAAGGAAWSPWWWRSEVGRRPTPR